MLNIAEGSGRYTKRDKRNFYVIARGSTFECVAIIDYLKEIQVLSDHRYNEFYSQLEELSKMLFSIIRSLKQYTVLSKSNEHTANALAKKCFVPHYSLSNSHFPFVNSLLITRLY